MGCFSIFSGGLGGGYCVWGGGGHFWVVLVIFGSQLLPQKRTKRCDPSAGADVVAPLGTSTMPPLWLEQGHAWRIIDELKKRRGGGGATRWLNFDMSVLRTAA